MKDNFVHINLPNLELQPEYTFLDLPQFQQPELLNCVEKLLDSHIKEGRGNAICIRTFEETWTYQDLYEKANQIAHVLVEE
jgi:2-aminobenzoate-CoA ligase